MSEGRTAATLRRDVGCRPFVTAPRAPAMTPLHSPAMADDPGSRNSTVVPWSVQTALKAKTPDASRPTIARCAP